MLRRHSTTSTDLIRTGTDGLPGRGFNPYGHTEGSPGRGFNPYRHTKGSPGSGFNPYGHTEGSPGRGFNPYGHTEGSPGRGSNPYGRTEGSPARGSNPYGHTEGSPGRGFNPISWLFVIIEWSQIKTRKSIHLSRTINMATGSTDPYPNLNNRTPIKILKQEVSQNVTLSKNGE